ncbi:PfaB family protein [Psychromonas sp. RZ22]|uniref:PfaB family protein n=1 Tax=Psychromonas algarum TaxID=2555643 RepID=UPI001067AB4D|nr:PfaB family protein [Psychromonas sp. RZ22]TEW55937.1 PfaB family protein [Psychromonas sp. RZ22]
MLSVIGLDVSFTSVKGIDAFDYHLYRNKPISLNNNEFYMDSQQLVDDIYPFVNGVLSANHIVASCVDLVALDDAKNIFSDIIKKNNCLADFASFSHANEINQSLQLAKQLSFENHRPTLILSINQMHFDGMVALLVCDKKLLNDEFYLDTKDQLHLAQLAQIKHCHCYAEINATSVEKLANFNAENESVTTNISQHIQQFLFQNKLKTKHIDSFLLSQNDKSEKHAFKPLEFSHQKGCLHAFSSLNSSPLLHELNQKTLFANSLISNVDLLDSASENFNTLLALVSGILCLDQGYRIAGKQNFIDQQLIKDYPLSGLYALQQSTSYLPNKTEHFRHILLSQICSDNFSLGDSHHLIQLSVANQINGEENERSVNNGFLAQQPSKPVIVTACNISVLHQNLNKVLNNVKELEQNFNLFCEQQYHLFTENFSDENIESFYCIVLIACSFSTLEKQIQLALHGITEPMVKPWKTPTGSYFSGELIQTKQDQSSLNFVYPGVGALYVGMGKDLLRLFPESYHRLLTMTDDLAAALQDNLMTPRSLSKPDKTHIIEYENLLRDELANIAEAGVSYACLLTTIFQEQLGLKATSAAGYSMGEVSMFAALGCWKSPHVMSQRLRESPIFTAQLSGPLKRLDNEWPKLAKKTGTPLWESYHIKAELLQVEALLESFPRVYITIINTPDSLVIAGDPEQCVALSKQLSVRAIALNVPNIIHCPLAKSEYENMQKLYSLDIKEKVSCKLFSSSCYLPIPITEKAIATSISKCLTEQVDFPRLIKQLAAQGERVFIEMGAGKSLGTWIERILKDDLTTVTCLSVNQKNLDDHSAILKTIAPLISLGYQVNLQSFFTGTIIRPVKKYNCNNLVS